MSAPPPLSTLAGSALSGTRNNITTLWSALAKQMPVIRNATHYYAHDMHRLGRELYTHVNQLRAQSEISAGEMEDIHGSSTNDGEAHYHSLTLSDLGVSVRKTSISRARDGSLILTLCIEGGFALFTVSATAGVTELAVELQHRDSSAVVDVLPINRQKSVVVFADCVAFYDVPSRSFGPRTPLSDAASGAYLMRKHIAVVSAEYGQILIMRLDDVNSPNFTETRRIIADRVIVASSDRWLAYCGESTTATDIHHVAAESAASAVTKSLKEGFAKVGGLLATTGTNGAPQERLGAVTITDVVSDRDVASFVAHDHNLQCMTFDSSGTILATASVAGTSVKLWHVVLGRKQSSVTGTIVLLAKLNRGYTTGIVTSIDFSPLNVWVAMSTSVGTCHIFAVPSSTASRVGCGNPSTYVAPTLTTFCRCRSAPSASPVSPYVCFFPWLQQRPMQTHLALVTAAASVAIFDVTERGVANILSQHLTEFTLPAGDTGAPKSDELDNETDSQPIQADFVWRSDIELRTHPASGLKIGQWRTLTSKEVERPCPDDGAAAVASVDTDWNEA